MNKPRIFYIRIIILVVIILIAILFGIKHFLKMQQIKWDENYERTSSEHHKYIINRLYNNNHNIFNFDENNKYIITYENLVKHMNGVDYFPPRDDKYGNDCVGYYIITKKDNNELDIDLSHECDMDILIQ